MHGQRQNELPAVTHFAEHIGELQREIGNKMLDLKDHEEKKD